MASRLEYYLGTGAAKSIYSEARNNTYSDAAQRRRAASMDRSTYDIAGEDGGVGMLGAGVKKSAPAKDSENCPISGEDQCPQSDAGQGNQGQALPDTPFSRTGRCFTLKQVLHLVIQLGPRIDDDIVVATRANPCAQVCLCRRVLWGHMGNSPCELADEKT